MQDYSTGMHLKKKIEKKKIWDDEIALKRKL